MQGYLFLTLHTITTAHPWELINKRLGSLFRGLSSCTTIILYRY